MPTLLIIKRIERLEKRIYHLRRKVLSLYGVDNKNRQEEIDKIQEIIERYESIVENLEERL